MMNELTCRCPACTERDDRMRQMAERNPSAMSLLQEGFVAANQDKSASDCPHAIGSESWQTWMYGWVNGVANRYRPLRSEDRA